MSDSIRRRFAVTVAVRVVSIAVSATTAGIVPRALGSAAYGNFQFLQKSFEALCAGLDASVSTAFITHSSKETKTGREGVVYGVWNLLHALLIALLIAVVVAGGWQERLWPGQAVALICAVAGLVLATRYYAALQAFADAKALTTLGQLSNLLLLLLLTITIISLFALHRLHLATYVAANYLVTGLAGGWLLARLWRRRAAIWRHDPDWRRGREFCRYAWSYSSPLLAGSLVNVAAAYFSRWLLQHSGGSTEQGYYSLALNWSQIVLLGTSAMAPIYWRELARANAAGDQLRRRQLLQRMMLMCYSLTVYFAAFIACQANFLVTRVAGPDFTSAVWPFMIMAFYPVTQTVGQLASVTLLACEQTRLYRNIGYGIALVQTALTYFLLAPATAVVPGLGLGAMGMALQMVITGFLATAVTQYFASRLVGVRAARLVGGQMLALALGVLLAWVSASGATALYQVAGAATWWRAYAAFFSAGFAYSALCLVGVWRWPQIAGLTPLDRDQAWLAIRRRLPAWPGASQS